MAPQIADDAYDAAAAKRDESEGRPELRGRRGRRDKPGGKDAN